LTTSNSNKPVGPGWHHLVAVRDRASLKLFLDGRLAGETKSKLAGQINLKPNTTLLLERRTVHSAKQAD
jgi:hypothetical protein